MAEDNPYSAPASELYEPAPGGDYGSVEKALLGDYTFTIGDTLSEAWKAIDGHKGTLWGAAAVLFLVAIAFGILTAMIDAMFGTGEQGGGVVSALIELPLNLVYYGVYAVMTTGSVVLGAKISMGLPSGVGELFRYMGRFLKGLLIYIVMLVLIALGFLLLIIPGIYLSVAYMFAVPLAVEKDMGIWQALETSRKALTKRWFTMLGFILVLSLLLVLGVLTLGIAYIWLVPMALVAYGIVYRNIFGLSEESLTS